MSYEKVLSVIVPVYNVEQYLRECLDSLIVDMRRDRMEVLVINDGSTDRSGQIAKEYENRFPTLFKVIIKENGGHGSALNTGIREASGKYLKVVDGDDWLDTKQLEKMLKFLEIADQDLVAANFYWVNTHTKKKKAQQKEPFQGVIYRKTYMMDEIADRTYIKMHSMIIKTEIMKKVPFSIDEHCYYVDSEYVMFPIPFVSTVIFLDSYLYMYRVGRMHQSVNLTQMVKNGPQHMKVFQRLLEYYNWAKMQGMTPGQMAYVEHGIALIFKSQYKVFLCCPYSEKIKQELAAFDHMVREEYPAIYSRTGSPAVKMIRMFQFGMFWPASYGFKCLCKLLKK